MNLAPACDPPQAFANDPRINAALQELTRALCNGGAQPTWARAHATHHDALAEGTATGAPLPEDSVTTAQQPQPQPPAGPGEVDPGRWSWSSSSGSSSNGVGGGDEGGDEEGRDDDAGGCSESAGPSAALRERMTKLQFPASLAPLTEVAIASPTLTGNAARGRGGSELLSGWSHHGGDNDSTTTARGHHHQQPAAPLRTKSVLAQRLGVSASAVLRHREFVLPSSGGYCAAAMTAASTRTNAAPPSGIGRQQ